MAQALEPQTSVKTAVSPGGKISYEEFLARGDEDAPAEWVEGEVFPRSPASDRHQDLADFLTAVLRYFSEARQLGKVRSAPFQMKTGPDLPGREPDVLFVSRVHLDRFEQNHLEGPADVAVEIISPESRARDRGEKYFEYEQGGIGEYWLIDPLRRQAEFYRLGEDGIYRLVPVGEDGIYRSEVLKGLWLRTSWLLEEPLPTMRAVFDEWDL